MIVPRLFGNRDAGDSEFFQDAIHLVLPARERGVDLVAESCVLLACRHRDAESEAERARIAFRCHRCKLELAATLLGEIASERPPYDRGVDFLCSDRIDDARGRIL